MKTILLVHGPNLNKLGERDSRHYGIATLRDIEERVAVSARARDVAVKTFQSNHEGALIDFLQEESSRAHGIIINPGALAHYSYALHDALLDTGLPAIEVHISDIHARESWRAVSVITPACRVQITGEGIDGYSRAVAELMKFI